MPILAVLVSHFVISEQFCVIFWKKSMTRMHSSRMHTARSSSRWGWSPPSNPPGTRHPLDQTPPPRPGTYQTRHPPVDRQTPVNILPCPKLCLRAVKIENVQNHTKVLKVLHFETLRTYQRLLGSC